MPLPSDRNSYRNLFPDMKVDGIQMADFWRAWQIAVDFKDKVKEFDTYILRDGDRWDTIAQAFYGERKLWWILVLFNDIENPFEIYFDKTIKNVRKTVKLIKVNDVSKLTNEIRRKRLYFETQDLSE
jgi:hypothetical protein